MEDVLAVYTRPHDPDRPLVCLDETSKQLIAETRVPIPMQPGRAARVDYEYARMESPLYDLGYAIVMFAGGLIAWYFGVNAERKSLEDIATPLSAVVRPLGETGAAPAT